MVEMMMRKIKYRARRLYRTALFAAGFGNHMLRNRDGARILVFHGISAAESNPYNGRTIPLAFFEALIRFLKQEYNLISLDDYYNGHFEKGTLNIALTFDDGLRNNYTLAAPVLEKYQVPATFFITPTDRNYDALWPDFIDLATFFSQKKEVFFDGHVYRRNRKNEFTFHGKSLKTRCRELEFSKISALYDIFEEEWRQIRVSGLEDFWELMTDEEILSLSKNPLFTIGAHGVTHASLPAINRDEAKSEIAQSIRRLKEITNENIDAFAFPFGDYDSGLIEICRAEGCRKVLLLDFHDGKSNDSTSKERFVITPYLDLKQLVACLLKNSYT